MRNDLTEIVLITDSSGSMSSCYKEMNVGIQQFLEAQKEQPGFCNITWVDFSSKVTIKTNGVDLNTVNNISIVPSSSTALNDAICIGIDTVGNRLANTPEPDRPALVIVCIVTDGQENASQEFKSKDVKERIERQSKQYNWQFMYLGANQDSFAVAQDYSIDINKVANYTIKNADKVFSSGVSCAASALRSMAFTGNHTYDSYQISNEVKEELNAN